MSMKRYYYVVFGAAIPRAQFPGNPWDDKWHTGGEMSVLDGGSNDDIYCGKVLGDTDPYEDFERKDLEIDQAVQERVRTWLQTELDWQEPPTLMLVCLWL